MFGEGLFAVLPAMMVFLIVAVPVFWTAKPPPVPAVLPVIVLLLMLTVPGPLKLLFLMPPPTLPAVLFVILLFMTTSVPGPLLPLLIPPASNVAELPVMSVLLMVTVPVLLLWMQPRLVAKLPLKVLPVIWTLPVPSS